MTAGLAAYLPSAFQLIGLGAVLAVAAALTALGAAIGRRRMPEADLMSGWGIAVLAFTAAGVLGRIPFRWVGWTLLAAAAISLGFAVRRERPAFAPGSLAVLVLGLPLLLVAAGMSASQWDEFSQWLWSARYLLETDGFPRAELPPNPASFPGYPYALAMVMYLAARIAGGFVENAGILFNLVLVLSGALLVARLIREGAGADVERPDPRGQWGLLAACVLATFLLPPAVVRKIALTTYAEVGTATAVAFAAVLGWKALDAVALGQPSRARVLALQAGLALAVLVSLKQANLVLAALIVAGLALAAWRTPAVGVRESLRILLTALAAPAAAYLLWRQYVALHLAGREFQLLPFAEWGIERLPTTLATMAGVALRKSGYFAFMLILSAFAVRALVRYRGPFDGLAIVVGTVFLGYNAFLLFAYIAIFGEWEGAHAVSYWRYNMHVGVLGGVAAAYGLAALARTRGVDLGRWSAYRWVPVVAVLVLPPAAADYLRFDRHPAKVYARQVGAELGRLLSPADRLILVDPLDPGIYTRLVRYELYRAVAYVDEVHRLPSAEALTQRLGARRIDRAWVHTQDDRVRSAFGLSLPEGASYLLAADGANWRVVRTWPYPGYRRPTDLPD